MQKGAPLDLVEEDADSLRRARAIFDERLLVSIPEIGQLTDGAIYESSPEGNTREILGEACRFDTLLAEELLAPSLVGENQGPCRVLAIDRPRRPLELPARAERAAPRTR